MDEVNTRVAGAQGARYDATALLRASAGRAPLIDPATAYGCVDWYQFAEHTEIRMHPHGLDSATGVEH